MDKKFHDTGLKINIFNPGTVDTDIRRNGQFPKWVRMLTPILRPLLAGNAVPPPEYADMLIGLFEKSEELLNESVLIDAKGRGIEPNKVVGNLDFQEELWQKTWKDIHRITGRIAFQEIRP